MELPAVGFGTSPYRPEGSPDGSRIDIEQPVRTALAAGYRLFDMAEMYGNEAAVGRALLSSGAPARSELVLVGKVWRTNFRPEHLRRACERSLQRLGIEAFDSYLLHAPEAWAHELPLDDASEIGWEEFERRAVPRDASGAILVDDVPLRATWEAMQDLRTAGLIRNLGVSNFTPHQIDALGEERPAVHQIPCWPMDLQSIAWHRLNGIQVMAYSPLRRDLLETAELRSIAAIHGRTPAQILLRWLLQGGIHPVTSSTRPEHIRESIDLTFELESGEIESIAALVPQV